MQHLYSLEGLSLANAWVTIGSFDGVHLGHQAIIRQMVREAHSEGAPVVVITFFPHPSVVLKSNHNISYLTLPDERAALLASLGADYVITIPFTRELANLNPTGFMNVLFCNMQIKRLWVGYDFALGLNREGNVERLVEIGNQMGFSVHVISPVVLDGNLISSSRIRSLLGQGDVEAATRLLGRYYSLGGRVVVGNQRGRKLGFPTANLQLPPARLLPVLGIYSTWAILNGQRFQSVTNIGIRPTFENAHVMPRVETFIIDFDQNIYDQYLEIELVKFLRPEHHHHSQQALIDQINLDISKSREVLNHALTTPGISTQTARA